MKKRSKLAEQKAFRILQPEKITIKMSNDSNKVKLIYDICSLPNEMNLNDFVYVWKKYGFVLYDSTKSESVPRVFSEKDIDSKSILVDISKADKEVLSKIQNLLKNVK